MNPHPPRRPSAVCRAAGLSAFSLAVVLLGIFSPQARAEPAAGWRALPAETVFCFRMPHTRAFMDNFRADTLAGRHIFTAEKFEQVKQLIAENDQENWDAMVADLAEAGFTIDDLLQIARNSWGVGVVADPREGEALPRLMMIGWADMDDADIDRVYAALDKAEAEGTDEANNRRVRFELAGLEVRQYSSAEMGMDREVDWSLPDDFDTMSPEQQEAHWAKIEKLEAEAKSAKIDETHILLTRMPGRMVMALGFPQSSDKVREMLAAEQDIDWDAATDVASVKSRLEDYLKALDGGADDSFAARVVADPAAAAAVASEQPLFEFYADGPALLDLIGLGIGVDSGEDEARQYRAVMDALGFNGLGVIAGSGHFNEGALRFDAFMQMAAPRAGLLGTLDGQTLPAAPPAWVPADVSYFHLAYDLGKLYDVVIDTMRQFMSPEEMQQVEVGNGFVQSQVEADIPTLLSSLGIRHSVTVAAAQPITRQVEEYDVETESFKIVERTTTMQPLALVWELADEAVWSRVMTTLKGFAPMTAGPDSGLEIIEDEAGFTGMRLDAFGLPMGFMLGQSKLVYGLGPDITDQTVAAINAPPAAGLVGSALYRQGDALINYRDGIFFSIQDGGRDLVSYMRQMVQLLEENPEGYDPAHIERIKQLLPSEDDLRAAFGVAVGQVTLGDNGLTYEAAAATPPAD